jgi:DNA-binding protein HU-beta
LRIAEEVIVNRSQLVGVVSGSTLLARRTVKDVVDVLFDSIVTEVRSGRKVTVIGFGTFTPSARAARTGRNPRSGAVVPIPASKGVRFATGSAFKSALNSKEGAPMAVKKAAAKKAVRKASAKKTAAKKTVARKAPARKTVAKKAPARKSAAKKAVKKAPARKAPARKTTAKKTAAKKAVRKKAVRKAPARKTTAKKTAAKKTAAKKAVRKAPARKTAARKTAKRTARKR